MFVAADVSLGGDMIYCVRRNLWRAGIALFALFMGFSAGAYAAEPGTSSSVTKMSSVDGLTVDLPEGVRQAVACAAENAALVSQFTLTFTRDSSPAIAGRYHVDSDTWTTVPGNQQDLNDLDDEVVEAWADVREEFGRRGALLRDDIAVRITQPVLIEETNEILVYSFVPGAKEGDRKLSDEMIEALDRRFVVDRKTGCMIGLSLKSTRPFKPALLASIEHFDFVWTFLPRGDSSVPLIASFKSSARGRALFMSFDESTTVTISDVQLASSS